jgi:hypothetical protein
MAQVDSRWEDDKRVIAYQRQKGEDYRRSISIGFVVFWPQALKEAAAQIQTVRCKEQRNEKADSAKHD